MAKDYAINPGDRVSLKESISIDVPDSTEEVLSVTMDFAEGTQGVVSGLMVNEVSMEIQFVYVDVSLREGVKITLLVDPDSIELVRW